MLPLSLHKPAVTVVNDELPRERQCRVRRQRRNSGCHFEAAEADAGSSGLSSLQAQETDKSARPRDPTRPGGFHRSSTEGDGVRTWTSNMRPGICVQTID